MEAHPFNPDIAGRYAEGEPRQDDPQDGQLSNTVGGGPGFSSRKPEAIPGQNAGAEQLESTRKVDDARPVAPGEAAIIWGGVAFPATRRPGQPE